MFEYVPVVGDVSLQCWIILGTKTNDSEPSSYYEEESIIEIQVNFGPNLLNKSEINGSSFDVTYCSKPIPNDIIIQDSSGIE